MKHSSQFIGTFGVLGLLAGPANAAIVVTNGDFESPDIAVSAQIQDVPDWFDSAGNFTSWHRGESTDEQENGTQLLAMGTTDAWVYQSLGTMDFAGGSLNWSLDKGRFADGNGSGALTVRFYSGSTGGAGEDVEINTLGLSQIGGDITLAAIGTDASGTGVVTENGSVDLTGLTAGTEIWIELSISNSGFAPFDNIAVSHVPEPGSLALLGLGGFAMLRRRRN